MPEVTVVTQKMSWAVVLVILAASAVSFAQQGPAPSPPGETHPAEDLFLRLGKVGLTASRVYHVRDAHIDRPGFYLTLEDGTIGFTEDVLGQTTGALFEGEGEVLVVPPDRAERSSLSLFTGSAILEERIGFGYIRFNDATYADLRPYLTRTDEANAFVAKWGSNAADLASADALRLLTTYASLLPETSFPKASPAQSGSSEKSTSPSASDRFLHARLRGTKLGAFDLVYDSQSTEKVQVLQLAQSPGASYYDIWMSFNPRHRGAGPPLEEADFDGVEIPSYKIHARVLPPRRLEAEAICELQVLEGHQRSLLFELSRYLQISRIEANGEPLEFIHNPAVTGTELARQGNDLVSVVFPRALQVGERLTLKFEYGGDVLSEEANGLLSVGARGTWYPNRGLHMADFDLAFSYPKGWTLLATGTPIDANETAQSSKDDSATGMQTSHWIAARPIPVAGFNLGRYVKASVKAGETIVEAYATGEMGLSAPKVVASGPAPGADLPTSSPPIPQFFSSGSPSRNVIGVAQQAADAVNFFSRRYGAFPYKSLALTQAPGSVSQGWPGLIFLSSYAFLSPEELASRHLRPVDAVLARQTPAHETAHQWWGDLVMWKSYRDQWISEGLASYCALLELEARDPAAFRLVMDNYRDSLLLKKDGRATWEAGPVTLGQRLNSSRFPVGYDVVAYGRGAWLFHMLREMLRDEDKPRLHSENETDDDQFTQVLYRLQQKYAGKRMSTLELLLEFEAHWPKTSWYEGKRSLDWFWDGWIQGVSIPKFEMKGVKTVRRNGEVWAIGTITRSDAPDDLVTPVPLYADAVGREPVLLGRIFSDGPETSFRVQVPKGTRKILLDPRQTLLRQP